MAGKVLVVDDDKSILEVIKIVLEDAGFEVVTVLGGANIEQEVEKKLPNLILIDIWMSGVDGREVTNRLKSNPKTKDIPVIVISAHNDTAKMAKEARADGFLAKPFDIDELIKTVKKYV